jgi:hypothetical protein
LVGTVCVDDTLLRSLWPIKVLLRFGGHISGLNLWAYRGDISPPPIQAIILRTQQVPSDPFGSSYKLVDNLICNFMRFLQELKDRSTLKTTVGPQVPQNFGADLLYVDTPLGTPYFQVAYMQTLLAKLVN